MGKRAKLFDNEAETQILRRPTHDNKALPLLNQNDPSFKNRSAFHLFICVCLRFIAETHMGVTHLFNAAFSAILPSFLN